MIEVEKNFDLKPGDKERLIRRAEFIGQKSFTDIYFDAADFSLTARDYWLRTRDGKFELKVPLNAESSNRRITDQYDELETEMAIAQKLGFRTNDLTNELAYRGYKPFAKIVTKRESYKKGNFHLDFDEMEFGFATFEVELMVANPSQIPNAEAEILKFAKAHGISDANARGKVIEYIFRNNPEHYRILKMRGMETMSRESPVG